MARFTRDEPEQWLLDQARKSSPKETAEQRRLAQQAAMSEAEAASDAARFDAGEDEYRNRTWQQQGLPADPFDVPPGASMHGGTGLPANNDDDPFADPARQASTFGGIGSDVTRAGKKNNGKLSDFSKRVLELTKHLEDKEGAPRPQKGDDFMVENGPAAQSVRRRPTRTVPVYPTGKHITDADAIATDTINAPFDWGREMAGKMAGRPVPKPVEVTDSGELDKLVTQAIKNASVKQPQHIPDQPEVMLGGARKEYMESDHRVGSNKKRTPAVQAPKVRSDVSGLGGSTSSASKPAQKSGETALEQGGREMHDALPKSVVDANTAAWQAPGKAADWANNKFWKFFGAK